MAQRHKKRKPKHHLTPKQITAASAQKYHVPFWILWGVAGAESTWGKGGSNLFGLTAVGEEHPNVDTSNWWQASALSAKTLSRLKHEHGTWEAALEHYSGGGYGTSHVKQLSAEQGITPQNSTQQAAAQLKNAGWSPLQLSPLWRLFHGEAPLPEFPGQEALPELGIPNPSGGSLGEVPGNLFSLPGEVTEAFTQFTKLAKLVGSPEFWIRVAEAIGGMILIYLALKQLTGNDVPGVGTARQYAKAAAFKRLPPKQRIK